LTFSWLNPLLRLGYSKRLACEDIPALFLEDEANVAYKKFNDTWEALVKDKSSKNVKNLVIKVLAKAFLKEMLWWVWLHLLEQSW